MDLQITRKQIKMALPADIYNVLGLIGRLAKKVKVNVYIVGGFVRDLFLGKKNFDIDITVESKGMEFAKLLAKKLNGRLVLHRRFGTASVFLRLPRKRFKKQQGDIMRIDIATARTERYERPATLPRVKFSSIKKDLLRRDFTINAIAISLNPETFGEAIDFFGGQQDISDGIIRVLHDKSFIDDPTRIFRAVRFEQRFNFRIEPYTMELIKNAVNLKMFEKVRKQRIHDEIVLILNEKDPLKALLRMDELHEFRFIHPKIRLTKKVLKILHSVKDSTKYFNAISRKKRPVDIWLIYFMTLLEELSLRDVQDLCMDFSFKGGDTFRMFSYKEKGDKAFNLLNRAGALAPSRIYRVLEPLSYEVILLIYAKSRGKKARMRVRNFLQHYSNTRLRIRGGNLMRFGFRPGPAFRNVLEKTLYAKIDGRLKTKKDEERFALRALKKK